MQLAHVYSWGVVLSPEIYHVVISTLKRHAPFFSVTVA
jgi:hypothetical protein